MFFKKAIKYFDMIKLNDALYLSYLNENLDSLVPFFEGKIHNGLNDVNKIKKIEKHVMKLKKDSHFFSIFQREYINAVFYGNNLDVVFEVYNILKDNVESVFYNEKEYSIDKLSDTSILGGIIVHEFIYDIDYLDRKIDIIDSPYISTNEVELLAFVETDKFTGFVGRMRDGSNFKITPETEKMVLLSADEIRSLKVYNMFICEYKRIRDDWDDIIYSYDMPNDAHSRPIVYAPYYELKRMYIGRKPQFKGKRFIPLLYPTRLLPSLSKDSKFFLEGEGFAYTYASFRKH